MRAEVGDRISVHSMHVGEPERDGEILEVHGKDGGPPFLVRWSDNGQDYWAISDLNRNELGDFAKAWLGR